MALTVASEAGTRRIRRSTDAPTLVVTALVVALLGLLILYPLLRILTTAADPAGISVMTGMLSSPVNRAILLNTVVLGALVGALGTLLGFLMAFLRVRVALPGKRLLHLLSLLPVVSPPFAVATGVISLCGRRGIIP